jgi:hypothetical protein
MTWGKMLVNYALQFAQIEILLTKKPNSLKIGLLLFYAFQKAPPSGGPGGASLNYKTSTLHQTLTFYPFAGICLRCRNHC